MSRRFFSDRCHPKLDRSIFGRDVIITLYLPIEYGKSLRTTL